jgi:hypothetical protein
MTDNQAIPAAQYLRMSTEHQQSSHDNQSTAIRRYAEAHGFEIVRTYSDAAKSGVVLKHRDGLRQSLEYAVKGDGSSTGAVCEGGWLGGSGGFRPVTCVVLRARNAAMTMRINTTSTTELFDRLVFINQ